MSDQQKETSQPVPVEKGAKPVDTAFALVTRFERFAWDIAGVLLLALSLMTLLALPGIPILTGGRLAGWAMLLRLWFGYGSLFVVLVGVWAGLLMLRRRNREGQVVPWMRIFALEGLAFSIMVLMTLYNNISLERAEAGLDGGRIGWGLAELMHISLSAIGLGHPVFSYLIVIGFFLLCVLVGFDLIEPILAWLQRVSQVKDSHPEPMMAQDSGVSVAPISSGEVEPVQSPASKKRHVSLPAEFRKRFQVPKDEESSTPPPPRDDRLPALSLLVNEQASRPDERNINLTAGLIEKTLAEFGIPAKVVGFRVGPTVTQFAVEPGFVEKTNGETDNNNKHKVRVSQISALQRDLALALSASRLRIEAPVPGRPYVGIEVPNTRSSLVRLRPILESEAFYKIGSPLSIALGRDVSGQPVVADLVKMPHLLIAGTTGSGKSVCIAAITTCLAMNNTPEDLRLVMIDPKMVELIRFNGLPHLYGKVETDIQRILGVMRWVVTEMDRRYKLLEQMRARHIDSYNRKVRRRKGGQPLPRIVVLIDELADLMMTAPEQTEPMLVRLAQLARATGIHLVVATQRPSTDVVTGLIKANFPARISFAVASSIDSRVILDTTGAESLLGHGDMLFLPPEASAPVRSQGILITDQEVERVLTFWQKAREQEPQENAPWEDMLKEEEVLADRDDLVSKAIKIVQDEQRASASMLQRRLRIGYPRAARLIDELEEMGIIGSSQGGGRERDVLIGPDNDDEDEI